MSQISSRDLGRMIAPPPGFSASNPDQTIPQTDLDRMIQFPGRPGANRFGAPIQPSQRLDRSFFGEAVSSVGTAGVRTAENFLAFKESLETTISMSLSKAFGDESQPPVGLSPRVKYLRDLLNSDALRPSDVLNESGGALMSDPRYWIRAFGENSIPIGLQIGTASIGRPATLFSKALAFAGPAAIQSAGAGYTEALIDLTGDSNLNLTNREIQSVAIMEGMTKGLITGATNTAQFPFLISKNPAAGVLAAQGIRATVGRWAITMGKAGTAEAIQEPIEGALQEIATMARKAQLGQEFSFDLDEFVTRRVVESVTAFPIGAVTGGSIELAGVSSQVREYKQARDAVLTRIVSQTTPREQTIIITELEAQIEDPDTSDFDKQNMRTFVDKLRQQGGVTVAGDPISLDNAKESLDILQDFPPVSANVSSPFAPTRDAMSSLFATRDTQIRKAVGRITRLKTKAADLSKTTGDRFAATERAAKTSKINQEIDQLRAQIEQDRVASRADIERLNDDIDALTTELEVTDKTRARLASLHRAKTRVGIANRIRKTEAIILESQTQVAQKELVKQLRFLEKRKNILSKEDRAEFKKITDNLQSKKFSDKRRAIFRSVLAKIESDPEIAVPSITEGIKSKLERGTPNDLTLEEATTLTNAILAAEARAEQLEEVTVKGQEIKTADAISTMLGEMTGGQFTLEPDEEGNVPKFNPKDIDPVEALPLTGPVKGKGSEDQLVRGAVQFKNLALGAIENLLPEALFTRLSGSENSFTTTIGYTDVAEAQDGYFQAEIDKNEFVAATVTASGSSPSEVRTWSRVLADRFSEKATLGIVKLGPQDIQKVSLDTAGTTVTMTPDNKMELAAILLDSDGYRRIVLGNNHVILEGEVASKEFHIDAKAAKNLFNPNHKDGLTESQLEVLNRMFRYVNGETRTKYINWSMNERHYEDTGEFMYWPVRRKLDKKIEQKGKQESITTGNLYTRVFGDATFGQFRKGGKDPIVIGSFFQTFSEHTRAVNGVAHMGPAIKQAANVFSDPRMVQLFESRFGDRITDRINGIYNEMAREIVGGGQSVSALDNAVRPIVNNVAPGILGLDPRIALGQVVSVLVASTDKDMSLPHMLGKIPNALSDSDTDEEIRLNSPRLHYRKIYIAHGIAIEGASSDSAAEGFKLKSQPSMAMIKYVDGVAIRVIWKTAKDVAISERLEGDAILQRTTQIADRVVNRTQPTSDPLHVSHLAIQAKTRPTNKLFVYFRGQTAKNTSLMIESAYRIVHAKNSIDRNAAILDFAKASILNALAFTFMKWLFSVSIRNAVRFAQGRELDLLRDDEDVNSLARKLAAKAIDTSVPFFGAGAATEIVTATLGLKERTFDPDLSPVLALSEAALGSLIDVGLSISEGDWDKILKNSADLFLNIAPLANIPVLGPSRHVKDVLKDQKGSGSSGLGGF